MAPGEPERAGRWWWEQAEKKECGLHIAPDGRATRASLPQRIPTTKTTWTISPHHRQRRRSSFTPNRMAADTSLTHLEQLEAESIHIIREAVAEFENPVMLYSIGKDSSVLLHLARKAFFPAKPPFPLLHVDTTWKFREMIAFRDARANSSISNLIVHVNRDGLERGINPITSGSKLHTDVMKTQALRQALDQYRFDPAFGGARRDEEKSRAKERVFSFRNANHAGTRSGNGRSRGASTTGASAAAKASACFRCRTGPSSTSGSTSTGSASRWCRCILRRRVRWSNATAR